MSAHTYRNQLSENWQLCETLSMLILCLQISLARAPPLFTSIIYLSCPIATLPFIWFIDFVHSFLSTLGLNNSKPNKTNVFNFFTSTSDEVIIALSKFHRNLHLSLYCSTNFSYQIQDASYPSRIKVSDF